MRNKKKKTTHYYKPKRKKWYVLFQNHPELTFILAGVVTFIFIFFFPYPIKKETLRQNLLSSTLEVFFLGLFVILYNKLSERKETIKRYRHEIKSYLPWDNKEATHRIVGHIRALNELDVSDIDLSYAKDLKGSYLWGVHLEGANLYLADLKGANLTKAHLEDANLFDANLEGAELCEAHLEGANLWEAHMKGANLTKAHLESANLKGAHMERIRLSWTYVDSSNWISGLKIQNCTGAEEVEAKYYVYQMDIAGKTVFIIREKQEYNKEENELKILFKK